jgi:site-specific recombinase XerC
VSLRLPSDFEVSMSLQYYLKGIMAHNRDGSFATQRERSSTLLLVAKQLKEAGFRQMKPESFKTKHIDCLVNRWKEEGLSVGTIKNRMSHLRWLAEKIAKPQIVLSNAALDIPNRCHVSNTDQSTTLTEEHLSKISDPHLRDALRLQETFGLRREEALKFIPAFAMKNIDLNNAITLKASWCKGGRERTIPVRNEKQIQLLWTLSERYGGDSLIHSNKKYVEMKDLYKNAIKRCGLGKGHGLRHAYAQQRYFELTGWQCSVKGGFKRCQLKGKDKLMDEVARMTISKELGHGRIDVVAQYLGS